MCVFCFLDIFSFNPLKCCVVSCVLTLLFVKRKLNSNPPHSHTHTPTDPGVVHRWDDNKHGKGVNISKCWLHKTAASKNSCREQRASVWPSDEGGVVAVFFSGLSHCGSKLKWWKHNYPALLRCVFWVGGCWIGLDFDFLEQPVPQKIRAP